MLKHIFNDEAATMRPDRLTKAELEAALAKICGDYLDGKKASETPHLAYVTGLPGAGKTTFIHALKSEQPEVRDYVHVNFDDLRIYHPRYADHIAQDPVNAAARIDGAVETFIGRLLEAAAARKLNVLLDDAAMGGDITRDILKPFQQNGYDIDATIVAVPALLAQQSVTARFVENLAAAKRGEPVIPRWVNTAEQEAAPAALKTTVEALMEPGLARRVTVVTRDGKPLASAGVDAVRRETERPLTEAERKHYERRERHIATLVQRHLPSSQKRAGLSPS